ncbi:MAG: hypothetical protein O7D95_06180 [Betaproteobacteria bacterium]|nr:hypothetical protein [Betaproteobacteria bacterium]
MEVPQGDTYIFTFTTRAFATGIPTTLAGTPVLSVKEEANDTIITSGVTIDVDTGSSPVTGLHEASVIATSGNGYEIGKYYSVFISTGTVASVSVVGETIGHFRIMPPEDATAGVKDVNVTHIVDGLVPAPTTTGILDVNVERWLDVLVTLSTGNKPDINVDEWGDVLLATTNPLPNVAAGAAGGVPTDTDANGAVRIVDGTGARELNTNAGAVANVDNLAGHTAQTGDNFAIVNSGTFGNAQLVRSTTPANTLDVSAGGEAGLDWANIGSPTTPQNLSATNIDVDQIVASVSGNVDGSVGSVTGGATSAAQTTAQNDLDIITGSDGAVIAGAQPNHIIFDDGIVVNTTTATRSGLELNGNTSGAGLKATGGATGNGISGTGGASGGSGLNAESLTGAGGIRAASSGAGPGMNVSSTTGVGMVINAGGSSDGLQVNGGGATNDIVGDLQGNVTGSVGSNIELGPSEVLAQVNAALDTAIAELSVAAPAVTPTLRTGLMLQYMVLRNQLIVQTSGTDALEVHNDAGTLITSKLLTDAGGDYTEDKMT